MCDEFYEFVITHEDGSVTVAPRVMCDIGLAMEIADVMKGGDGIRNVVPRKWGATSVKQVIVMRTDLNMRKGKMCAQAAHASMGCLLQQMKTHDLGPVKERVLYVRDDSPLRTWLEGSFTKICVGVSSEQELMEIHDSAKLAKLDVCLIEDNGLTEFNGVKTKTCLAIGPDYSESIDKITKHLKLL